jgi:hypothetical protein
MTMLTDRDLLLIEPSLFSSALGLATLLIDVTDGNVSGTSLTSAGSDFASMGIDAGHVAVIDGETTEVVERVSATELTVSLPRVTAEDPLIAPAPGSSLSVKVPTFGRQINLSRGWVLGSLGIEIDDEGLPLGDSILLNATEVEKLIALETIARLFHLAAALDPTDQSLAEMAAHYAGELTAARHRTQAVLDLDGDGVADASRRVSVATLIRI